MSTSVPKVIVSQYKQRIRVLERRCNDLANQLDSAVSIAGERKELLAIAYADIRTITKALRMGDTQDVRQIVAEIEGLRDARDREKA